MFTVTTRSIIAAEPDAVFRFVADQTNAPRWQSGLKQVRRLTAGPIGVGTEHEFTRTFAGRILTSRNRFVRFEPGHLVEFEVPGAWLSGRAAYLVEPVTGGTRLISTMQFSARGAWRVLEPFLRLLLVRETSKDEGRLAAILASAATPDPSVPRPRRFDPGDGRPGARTATLSILIGSLLGVTWAAGFRAFMAEIAGPDSVFGWYATFGVVLGGAGIVGGLMGWADHIRRTGGRPHWRWLALSPLILGLLPLTVPGTLAALAQGIGTAGMAVALIAIGLGYTFGGLGRAWLRVIVGAISAGAAIALVAFTPLISDGRISFSDPRGAWAGTLALGSIVVVGLATSIPFRPVLPLTASADASPPVIKDRAPEPV
ncbi:SRPBCC family protein [Microbacterium sp. NPDC057407]|uniref:SRPBCC family protein n=1 Tax=unclassified Microbacterium TaxID=2609290 RepID=UPI0035D8E893